MPCYKPVKAFYGSKLASGKREIVFSSGQAQSCADLSLPCGGCVGCRLERARQWAMRCVDESKLHEHNSFITLTIAPEHMSRHGRSVSVPVFQMFLKRLRKAVAPLRLRFFIVLSMVVSLAGRIIMRLFSAILFLIVSISRLLKAVSVFTALSCFLVYGTLVILVLVISRSVLPPTWHVTISRRLDL
nr:replication associated protein [Flumine microvirus 11]